MTLQSANRRQRAISNWRFEISKKANENAKIKSNRRMRGMTKVLAYGLQMTNDEY